MGTKNENVNDALRQAEELMVDGKRARGRPKMSWKKRVDDLETR